MLAIIRPVKFNNLFMSPCKDTYTNESTSSMTQTNKDRNTDEDNQGIGEGGC